MKRVLGASMLTAVVIAIAACDSEKPAPPPVAKPRPKPAPVAEVAPASADGGTDSAAAAPYIYSYNPVAKRDPFRNLFVQEPGGKKGDEPTPSCTEALCQYDLDQLTLVAVVSGDANPVAMLEDQAQVGHIVHRNTKVGKQGGKVTQILRNCIVITEYFTSTDGKLNPNRVSICVKEDKQENRVLDLLNNKQIE